MRKDQEKDLRGYWPQYKLRFLQSGDVIGRRKSGGKWLLIYSKKELKKCLEEL